MAERRTIEVWADWQGLKAPSRMGLLHATPIRGKEIFSFEYDTAWLTTKSARGLDPSLRFLPGPQYVEEGRKNFGLFLDSAPDRWGRVLLARREALLARAERRSERRLTELDFLLGVYDGQRMGGLRFRFHDGAYLDDNKDLASPPWTSLRDLEQASLHLEKEGVERSSNYGKWLKMLIAPGRSLGGARPKASVTGAKGRLWIAKFPSANDSEDIGAWESVVHALAERAGVTTTEAKRERFGSKHHTFLSERFDRTERGARIHFASAMTLLGQEDGEAGASYLDLAAVIARHGAQAAADLEQLWRRIVFFMCVSNVDDDLRNHGFLMEDKGWRLAPAYDMNPVAFGSGLTLNVSETDNAQDLRLALSVAPHFRVKAPKAKLIAGEVKAAVRRWRTEAKKVGLSRAAQDRMAPAFRVAET